MEGFSVSIFKITLGWIADVVRQIWNIITDPSAGNLFTWIGNHWKPIVIILCAVGSIADLLIYLIRWRPIQVWKSYFRRKKRQSGRVYIREGSENITRPDGQIPAFDPGGYDSARIVTDPYTEDDSLDRWREPDENFRQDAFYVENFPGEAVPNQVVPAGSGVPADSPYRRPASAVRFSESKSSTERNLEKISPRRRRKRGIPDVFGQSEEEMPLYEAPQPVIDSTEAYHAPVYPRNWKENGDNP